MVAKDYIPTTVAKNTVEKIVEQKPKIEELTKIEVPGKPSSAFLLEKSVKKKGNVRVKKDIPKKSESRQVRDHLLIITEKPQAANKIANAIGDARKLSEGGVPYYELEVEGKKDICGISCRTFI